MSLRLRPRFDIVLPATPDEAMERMREALKSEDCGVLGHKYTLQYELRVPRNERHFWSPFLNLLIETHDDKTHLMGRFGPDASVWTMFLATYTVLALSGGVGLIVASSQWSIQQSPTGLIATGAAIILSGLVYLGGKFGESLAMSHIHRLLRFVEQAYEINIELE